uniref:Uncharacterized protein n=1 Tax=Timema cristinae TaxID=61476 RepID=A0A7R9H646_TIMCR|nr:unnamed protein product [Timema cristinae]
MTLSTIITFSRELKSHVKAEFSRNCWLPRSVRSLLLAVTIGSRGLVFPRHDPAPRLTVS